MQFKTKGVCSSVINIDVVDSIIKHVDFVGGCNGNLQGISRLVEGMNVKDAIAKLQGIHCGFKSTSCPDQLAQALKEYV
ncbi:MAG: TIGR03905 family TSCPD domain-containing protein [Suipraeoptans sp.]